MASLKPPFTQATAQQKVKAAQAAWNTRSPTTCALAYTEDSVWRNRDVFLRGRAEIEAFLTAKWARELDYRLRKELFAFGDDRIAVQFWYEYRDAAAAREGRTVWRRAYGLEDWTFAPDGRMRKRQMSANEVGIAEADRWFAGELGEGETVDELVQRAEIGEAHW